MRIKALKIKEIDLMLKRVNLILKNKVLNLIYLI